jgi:hypothetical protein
MELLTLASSVLYEQDILDKMAEILKLKKDLQLRETQLKNLSPSIQIEFNSYEEYSGRRSTMKQLLRTSLESIDEESIKRFPHIWSYNSIIHDCIKLFMGAELYEKFQEWSWRVSRDISNAVECALNCFPILFWDAMEHQDRVEYIYTIIEHKMEDRDGSCQYMFEITAPCSTCPEQMCIGYGADGVDLLCYDCDTD